MPYATDDISLRRETDVQFYVAGGPGGQHRNKNATGVRLRHRPSGVRVRATERRSRSQNLAAAWARLRAKLESLNEVPAERKPTKPSRAAVAKRLGDKAQTSERKRRRRPVESSEE